MVLRKLIGERVRGLRQARGLTLEKAAHQVGMDPAYLTKIELGLKNVTLDSLAKILDGLEADPIEFFAIGRMSDDQRDKEEFALLKALLPRMAKDARQQLVSLAKLLAGLNKPR